MGFVTKLRVVSDRLRKLTCSGDIETRILEENHIASYYNYCGLKHKD